MLRIEHLVQLSVGIRFPVIKESEALLGILKVEFKPDHAELTIFLRYKFHVKNSDVPERDIFLGEEGIHFTTEGEDIVIMICDRLFLFYKLIAPAI
jgi:hypothetical protein